MMRKMKGMQKWGDVAPALLISRQRSRSSFPRLDTIIEEGSGNNGVVAMPKRVLFLLPIVASLISYFFMQSRYFG
ncbi:hypothetical protein NC652_027825 [Populus alba x Populus x berolinensis]|nr:hypothetical protein NC652_027825 [Populus alba x Populus x berolinensis]